MNTQNTKHETIVSAVTEAIKIAKIDILHGNNLSEFALDILEDDGFFYAAASFEYDAAYYTNSGAAGQYADLFNLELSVK